MCVSIDLCVYTCVCVCVHMYVCVFSPAKTTHIESPGGVVPEREIKVQ